MNSKQLRELADKMDEEDIVRKIGYLKEDYYSFDSDGNGFVFSQPYTDFWLLTKKEKIKLINQFESKFELVLLKGTKFNCYVIDGKECWFDDVGYGVEMMNSKWAEKNLENINEENN